MSRQFSIPTMLRMVPNSLLKHFFPALACPDLGVDWDRLGQWQVETVMQAICDLPNDHQDRIGDALHAVFELSCASGIDAILEVADRQDEIQLINIMPEDANFYARAMWYWVARPESFERALRIHTISRLRWWRKRNDLPKKEPRIDATSMARLRHAISNVFLQAQGRGQTCTIETMYRRGINYLFVYPDDFVQGVTIHDADGMLVCQSVRPTFNIVFAYDAAEGTLELFAKVSAKIKRQLEQLFVQHILDDALGDWSPEPAYALDHLKYGRFRLATDPWDRLEVRIRRMRLSLPSSGRDIWIGVNMNRTKPSIGHSANASIEKTSHLTACWSPA